MDTTTTATGTRPETIVQPELLAGLPTTFRWGAATAAYQIEGAVNEDGRTPSIWDTYCRTPGAVDNGDSGDIACDHYHRMPQDVALMRELEIDTYRFSIAWPRIQPHGSGPVNPAGVAFYDRLVDELLGKGIDPWITLYHWDLPQELEDAGGWPVRDTAYRFADYSMLVFDALGDRVRTWTTLNEPWCSAMLGYYEGRQAPGRTNFGDAISAVHHLLLGHGLTAQRLRAASSEIDLGITLNMSQGTPDTDSEVDREATRRADGLGVRLYLDPLVHGRYPEDVVADLAERGVTIPVQDGDLKIISSPIEVLGVNSYFCSKVSGVDENGNTRDSEGHLIERPVPFGRPVTAMDWEIVPEGFGDLLVRLGRDYPGLPIVVTENGSAFRDEPDERGFVEDIDRVEYFASHISAVARAVQAGTDVRGYFAWSLMDNFEWSYGYDKRFGLVHVDYDTLERTPKRSSLWYRDLMRQARTRD